MNRLVISLALVISITGCVGVPKGIKPVKQFELQPYLGKWYEVARLDHSFERGMQNVTAEYSLREDGGVKVTNAGFLVDDKKWDDAMGKAYFVEDANTGHLKVSFFGPFYASYVIFELDSNYQHAFVAGNSRNYLWLLSRTPTISDELKQHFLHKTEELGFNTKALIWVSHEDRGS